MHDRYLVQYDLNGRRNEVRVALPYDSAFDPSFYPHKRNEVLVQEVAKDIARQITKGG